MNETQTKHIRRRAKVNRTSKGYSIEVSLEIDHEHDLETFMAELKALFDAVDEQYPQGEA